MGIATKCWRN